MVQAPADAVRQYLYRSHQPATAPTGKVEIDVAADYLFKLRQAMRAALQKTLGEVFNREERNIRYYLTVPAIWNDAGKAATRAAAIQAGFLGMRTTTD